MLRQKYKFNSKNHPKTHDMPTLWLETNYISCLSNPINIDFNGGVSLHTQYKRLIQTLQVQSGGRSKYGAQLFIYMLEMSRRRHAKGFKVCLDGALYKLKKGDKADVSYASWVNVLEYAVAMGYGVLTIGDSWKVDKCCDYKTVFEISRAGWDLVKDKALTSAPSGKFISRPKETVITTVKDKTGKEVEVKTVGAPEERKIVNELNTFVSKYHFKTGDGQIFDPQMRRKFSLYKEKKRNNGLSMFESYGRFINVAQSMTQEERSKITINNEPTVECDYSSNHAFIAYEMKGIKCSPNFKPYMLDESPLKGTHKQNRLVYKMGMMMCFNAKSSGAALDHWIKEVETSLQKDNCASSRKAIMQGMNLPTKSECFNVTKLLRERNKDISEYFGGYANLLQNKDSRIAENVMKILMKQNIPFLCIHDSFIVPASKEKKLIKAMHDAWKIVLGSNHNCRVDTKTNSNNDTQNNKEVLSQTTDELVNFLLEENPCEGVDTHNKGRRLAPQGDTLDILEEDTNLYLSMISKE